MAVKKRKTKPGKNSTYYESGYDPEEFHTMKRYGAGDLYNEVELVRAIMFRALGKMNEDIKKLTFQDHLSALHAFSRASGRVAHLMETQQRLFSQQEEFNQLIRGYNDKMAEAIDKDIASLEEQGKEIPEWLLERQAAYIQRMLRGEG